MSRKRTFKKINHFLDGKKYKDITALGTSVRHLRQRHVASRAAQVVDMNAEVTHE